MGLTANTPNSYSFFFFSQQYGSPPSKEEIVEAGNSCPICQEDLKDPIKLRACKVRRWWDILKIDNLSSVSFVALG